VIVNLILYGRIGEDGGGYDDDNGWGLPLLLCYCYKLHSIIASSTFMANLVSQK